MISEDKKCYVSQRESGTFEAKHSKLLMDGRMRCNEMGIALWGYMGGKQYRQCAKPVQKGSKFCAIHNPANKERVEDRGNLRHLKTCWHKHWQGIRQMAEWEIKMYYDLLVKKHGTDSPIPARVSARMTYPHLFSKEWRHNAE